MPARAQTDRLNVFYIIKKTWYMRPKNHVFFLWRNELKTQFRHYANTGVLHINDKPSWNKVIKFELNESEYLQCAKEPYSEADR